MPASKKPDKKNTDKDKSESEFKVVAQNRRARHEYTIIDSMETGIELVGTEVKSIRQGKASLQDAFARIEGGEVYLYNCNIAVYEFGNRFNHEPLRKRRLLLQKKQILKLKAQSKEKGLTLVPLKLYFKRNWVKVDLALGKGKHLYDKRETIAKRDTKRELDRLAKTSRR
jgi:SsrA-binding protein